MTLSKNHNFYYRCFSLKLCQKRSFFGSYERNNEFSRKENKSFKKGPKMDIFKGVSPWILSKNRTFSYRSFLQKLCEKRTFLDNLNRKQSF